MASTINAKSSGAGGIEYTGDASGTLGLQANGSTIATVSSAGVAVTGALTTTGAITSNGVVSSPYTMKNRIINGDMRIDQRNAGASVATTTANAGVYTLDRWFYYASQTSKYTVQQNAGSVTPPAGFTNYIGVTIAASTYAPTTAEEFSISQVIEGFNISDLGWGTANAQTITLSFWVRSSVTGTFGGSLRQGSGTRSYPFTYTISSANTWEKKSITIAGDTSGTWNSTNGAGIILGFQIGNGATASGTPFVWASANTPGATGALNLMATANATLYITGVQLEAGSAATSFEWRHYGQELINCQRYCIVYPASTYFTMSGWTRSTDSAYESGTFSFTPMRVAPTASATSTFGFHVPNVWIRNTTTNIFTTSIQTISFSGTVSNSGSTGVVFGTFYKNTDGVLKLEAEL